MSDYEPITGVILEAFGVSPGPASGITYRIGVNWRGTSFVAESQTPSEERWPDSVGGEPFHVRAVNVGRIVRGDLDVNTRRAYWWFRELPDLGPCDDEGGNGANLLPVLGPDGRPLIVPPPPPVPGTITGMDSAPDPGGEGAA